MGWDGMGWDGMGWVKGWIRCQVGRWRRSTLLNVSFDYRCDGSFETLWWEIGTFRLGIRKSQIPKTRLLSQQEGACRAKHAPCPYAYSLHMPR